jgi:hypothetical protein
MFEGQHIASHDVRTHDLLACDIGEAMGEIASYHDRD